MYHVTSPVVQPTPHYLRPTHDTHATCINAAVLNLKVFLNNESIWFQEVHVVLAQSVVLVYREYGENGFVTLQTV